MLRRSFAGFDSVARRRLMETITRGPMQDSGLATSESMGAESAMEDSPFAQALPLLYRILGIKAASEVNHERQ
jgi:hypothetical protein